MHLQYPLFALLLFNQIEHFLLLVQGLKEGNLAPNSGIHLASVIDEIGLRVWNGSTVCSCFPCFRKNVVATCKIGSFLSSLDNLLQKNVIVLFFGNHISKWRSFEKRTIFDLLFTFFSHQGKLQKFLQHISHSHTHTCFAHPIDFFALPILKKIRIFQVRFLFGMSPGVDSYWCHFGTINK